MDNDHFGGLVMILTGVLMAGIVTLMVFLGYRKLGPLIWKKAGAVTIFVCGWVISATLTIVGIYLISKPEKHARHARIGVERQAGVCLPQGKA